MKEAMWKIDESGQFTFSDATVPEQLQLFGGSPDLRPLKHALEERFRGRQVEISEIETFVLAETPFRETHFKGVLQQLEQVGALHVDNPPPNRRTGTFGRPQMKVRFT
jgi:hypothetical protein